MTSRSSGGAALSAALTLAACATLAARAPEVSPAVVAAGATRGSDRAVLERGRSVFATECARCHVLPRIDEYSTEAWPDILTDMSDKAALDPGESAAVEAFVLACSLVRT